MIKNFKEMMDLPNADGYHKLLPITQLRIRDRILNGYMHVPHDELIDELQSDLLIMETYEEFELAQAYKDLIEDLIKLDFMNE